MLTSEERREILKYPEVYYIGSEKSREPSQLSLVLKLGKSPARSSEKGLFRVVEGAHIAYRYEVLGELGRGAFG